mgnify:CR=1 FL=1
MSVEAISVAEPLWFNGHQGERTHAWYYPPSGKPPGPAPLLVKSHSGPTAMARRGLSLAIQYWTSRGWGVVDVNYGGSTRRPRRQQSNVPLLQPLRWLNLWR